MRSSHSASTNGEAGERGKRGFSWFVTARNCVEKRNGISEEILQRPFSVNLHQHEFPEQEFLDFIELFK